MMPPLQTYQATRIMKRLGCTSNKSWMICFEPKNWKRSVLVSKNVASSLIELKQDWNVNSTQFFVLSLATMYQTKKTKWRKESQPPSIHLSMSLLTHSLTMICSIPQRPSLPMQKVVLDCVSLHLLMHIVKSALQLEDKQCPLHFTLPRGLSATVLNRLQLKLGLPSIYLERTTTYSKNRILTSIMMRCVLILMILGVKFVF
mmetsp:Transcript_316/g.359  ORF Transcript_316/g.359 Transcript_316/m.359 type:complete len:202 (-) Transcript_316:638-1243(-)